MARTDSEAFARVRAVISNLMIEFQETLDELEEKQGEKEIATRQERIDDLADKIDRLETADSALDDIEGLIK